MSWTKGRYEEFQEEDVWGVWQSREHKFCNLKSAPLKCSSSFISRPLPSAARMIPMSNSKICVEESRSSHHSAPVNVPDWSKIYGSLKAASPSSRVAIRAGDGGYEEEEEGGDGGIVPPHELIGRRLARRDILSFSMCEGVGRTLKGRDLSRVRNDVLTKTGFLE